MCGRLREKKTGEELRSYYSYVDDDGVLDTLELPRMNVAPWYPGQKALYPQGYVPAIRPNEAGSLSWAALKWRFIPRTLKSLDVLKKYDTINSRGDRMPNSNFYKHSFQDRRCLVIADGFYEWEDKPRPYNVPWFIHMRDDAPFAIAGLWDRWKDPHSGEVHESCAIATTDPNSVLSHFHHRMPVIIRPEDQEQWLYGSPAEAEELLRPYAQEEAMESYRVSKYVSVSKNEGLACFAPLQEEVAEQGELKLIRTPRPQSSAGKST